MGNFHYVTSVINFMTENNICVHPCPANSTDNNPIENLLAIDRKKVGKMTIKTKTDLTVELTEIWHWNEDIKRNCEKS